ncbi:MAG: sialidase family protein [Candidatus Thermoplasmatota archaeon]|nr:sialidase family protein [Candidatus Thermoplasmatota archaeon]
MLSEDDGYVSWHPKIAVNGNNIHVVWNEAEKYSLPWSFGEIVYMRSTDGGSSWEDGKGNPNTHYRLTNDPADSDVPHIAVSGNNIHVAWPDKRSGNFEPWYKSSEDNGGNWTEDKNITPLDGIKSHVTDIAADGNRVYAVGRDEKWVSGAPYYSIWFVRSEDNGKTWSEPLYIVPEQGGMFTEAMLQSL